MKFSKEKKQTKPTTYQFHLSKEIKKQTQKKNKQLRKKRKKESKQIRMSTQRVLNAEGRVSEDFRSSEGWSSSV